MSWPGHRARGRFRAGRRTTLGDIRSCGRAKVAAVLSSQVVHPDRHQLLEVALRIALEGGIGKGDPALCLLAEDHLDGAVSMDRTRGEDDLHGLGLRDRLRSDSIQRELPGGYRPE